LLALLAVAVAVAVFRGSRIVVVAVADVVEDFR
jgi:hypothetical protein